MSQDERKERVRQCAHEIEMIAHDRRGKVIGPARLVELLRLKGFTVPEINAAAEMINANYL